MMKPITRAVHLDFHTLPDIPDFGKHFNAECFARTLKEAHVQYVAAFAKCNIGYAYYPTKIGTPHPHLHFDMLGQMVEACHRQGIALTAYFNVGLDHELARKRRDWAIQNKEGQVIFGDRTENFFRIMCLNTGYRRHILDMIREVIERYPVDGVFLDCMNITPCYGDECLCSVRQRGMDPLNDADVGHFAADNIIEFSREVKRIVGDEKYLYLNGLGYKHSKGLRTHEEIECLPSGWGYDFFPAHAAYARNLGHPVFYMTGRFHQNWGDFGGLKPKASLQNDLWDGISNAVGVSIGDHMHPRDGLEPAVYQRIGELYADLESLEPWTLGAKAVAEVGILTPDERIAPPQQAAARMLGELKYTYDVLDQSMDLSQYKVLILPDEVTIGPILREKLEVFLAAGGGIIGSGQSGLNPDKSGFALDAWDLDYQGQDPWNVSFLRLRNAADIPELPDMAHAIHRQAIRMKLKSGARTVADYIQPYFDRRWNGFHGSFYTPPDRPAGWPALAQSRNGRIFHFCFNLFADYAHEAMAAHRQLLHYCLRQLLPEPILICRNIPSTARVTLTAQDNRRMIHVKLTHPETRGRYGIIEDLPVLYGGVIGLRASKAGAVYRVPSRAPVPFERNDDRISLALPPICGYAMFVVE